MIDVTLGSWDGAECAELVGLFLLLLIRQIIKDIALFRDDSLGVSCLTARQTELAKKKISAIFKEHKLQVVMEANSKMVNYLDVNLDLRDGSFRPYLNPGSIISYVSTLSNHPPNILKSIPEGIKKD